jgi:hypothetical protein
VLSEAATVCSVTCAGAASKSEGSSAAGGSGTVAAAPFESGDPSTGQNRNLEFWSNTSPQVWHCFIFNTSPTGGL